MEQKLFVARKQAACTVVEAKVVEFTGYGYINRLKTVKSFDATANI